jgi:hypothetical protein
MVVLGVFPRVLLALKGFYAELIHISEAWVRIAMIRLMLKRLRKHTLLEPAPLAGIAFCGSPR